MKDLEPIPPHPLGASILLTDDRPPDGPHHIEAWNIDVWVRSMDAAGGGMFQRLAEAAQEAADDAEAPVHRIVAATCVALTACDEIGVALFSVADVEALAAKSMDAVQALAELGIKASGLAGDSEATAAKN